MKYVLTKDGRKYTFDVKILHHMLPKEEMIKYYSAIKHAAASQKKFVKKDPQWDYLANLIRRYKAALKEYKVMLFKLEATIGDMTYYEMYKVCPVKEDIKNMLSRIVIKMKQTRAVRKEIAVDVGEYNGLRYQKVGGVFTDPGSVAKMKPAILAPTRMETKKKPHPKMKAHHIGIELEFISAATADTVKSLISKAGLGGAAYLTYDGSIEIERDNEKQHELTLLMKQEDVRSVVSQVCKILASDQIKAYVNNSCGMHVHFDVRHRSAPVVYNNLVRILPVLAQLIPVGRTVGEWANKFCMMNPTADINEAVNVQTGHANVDRDHTSARYQAINPFYKKYNTIEVRMHSGTLNTTKIVNWVDICLAAVESAFLDKKVNTIQEYIKMFNPKQELIDYMLKRAETFKTRGDAMDTRSDHFFNSEVA